MNVEALVRIEGLKPITVVIPAYNEGREITAVLSALKNLHSDFIEEVIVVDDGSQDETSRVASEAGVRVIRHARNRGYGAALKTGIQAARTEFVVTIDSDGQHDPADILRLWSAASGTDMVVGRRTALLHSQLWRMPGKWLLSILANYLCRERIPDLNSGLRLMRRDVVLRYLHLCPAGFSFSTTITMAFFNRGYRVEYVPIEVEKRIGRSTVSLTTGMATAILILRIASLFDPLRVFIPLSVLIGSAGFVWSIPYAMAGRGLSVASMLAMVTAILIFSLGLICDQVSQLRLERYER